MFFIPPFLVFQERARLTTSVEHLDLANCWPRETNSFDSFRNCFIQKTTNRTSDCAEDICYEMRWKSGMFSKTVSQSWMIIFNVILLNSLTGIFIWPLPCHIWNTDWSKTAEPNSSFDHCACVFFFWCLVIHSVIKWVWGPYWLEVFDP